MTVFESTAVAPVPRRTGMLEELWNARELLGQLVRRDLRLRYRQAVMGIAWALLMPVLTVTAGLIIRLAMARAGGVGDEHLPGLGGIAIKSWAWTFFAGAMNFGTVSLLGNMNLVSKIYFPREVLPLASIITQSVDSLIGLAVILCASPWLGFHWTPNLLWVPLLLALLLIFTTGLAFLFACANLFFRDVKYILQVLLMFGIFFTPVFVEPSTLGGTIGRLMMINPLSPILEGLRLAMTQPVSLMDSIRTASGALAWTPWYLVYAAGIGLVCLGVGLLAFRRSAAMFAEYY